MDPGKFFLIKLGDITHIVKSIGRILSAYTGVDIKITNTELLLLLGSFLPWPRVEIFLYDSIVGVLFDPGKECIRAGDFYFIDNNFL